MFLLNEIHTKGIGLLAPELLLVAVSLLVLVLDLVWKERDSSRLGWISIGGLALAALLLILGFPASGGAEPTTAFGIVTIDRFGNFFKLFTCASLAVVIFFVTQDRRERKHRIGEYYFLLLGAAIGIFFMVGTNNLLLLVLGLDRSGKSRLCSHLARAFPREVQGAGVPHASYTPTPGFKVPPFTSTPRVRGVGKSAGPPTCGRIGHGTQPRHWVWFSSSMSARRSWTHHSFPRGFFAARRLAFIGSPHSGRQL